MNSDKGVMQIIYNNLDILLLIISKIFNKIAKMIRIWV